GFVIGAFVGLGRLSKNKFIFWLCTVYVEVIRGTPILVQIFFIYFGLSDFYNFDKLTASIIAISLNAGHTLQKSSVEGYSLLIKANLKQVIQLDLRKHRRCG